MGTFKKRLISISSSRKFSLILLNIYHHFGEVRVKFIFVLCENSSQNNTTQPDLSMAKSGFLGTANDLRAL